MDAAPTRRLFVGLALDEELATRLLRRAATGLRGSDGEPLPGHRLHAVDELHLTLAFLGDWPEERRPELQGLLTEELRGLRAPELRLGDPGGFPDLDAARVLFVGVDEDESLPGRLWALRNRAWQAALSAGWRASAVERRRGFRPHVTLARLRGVAPDPAFRRLMLDGRWLPTDVHVFESRRDGSLPRYLPLAGIPLVVQPG